MPGFDYLGWFAYSLTLVTRKRQRVFGEAHTVQLVLDGLSRSLDAYGFTLHAYCFMPDHLHLLVAGSDRSSLLRFTQHLKQLSGYAYKKATGEPLWQISYWDHVLRSDEDLAVVARYIWANPVRAGLAEDAQLYPFSGPQPLPEVC